MILYKYYTLSDNSIQALTNNYFYMANFLEFNDPFELSHQLARPNFESEEEAKNYINRIINRDIAQPEVRDRINSYFTAPDGSYDVEKVLGELEAAYSEKDIVSGTIDELSKAVGVTCFSQVPDNEFLWAYYGDGLRGICIEYELPDKIIGGHLDLVDYNNTDSPIITMNSENIQRLTRSLSKLLFKKHERYADEKEIRLVMGRQYLESNKYYPYLPSNIRSVFFGEKADSKSLIRDLFSGDQLGHVQHYKAKANRENYSIEITTLD